MYVFPTNPLSHTHFAWPDISPCFVVVVVELVVLVAVDAEGVEGYFSSTMVFISFKNDIDPCSAVNPFSSLTSSEANCSIHAFLATVE